jgi:hypothetical protein
MYHPEARDVLCSTRRRHQRACDMPERGSQFPKEDHWQSNRDPLPTFNLEKQHHIRNKSVQSHPPTYYSPSSLIRKPRHTP